MSLWFQLWLALAGLIALIWIIWLLATFQVRRKRHILNARTYLPRRGRAPLVSVVIAAKDEEDHIEECLLGLLAQDYPAFEIIVADDRSQDQTPSILRRLQRQAGDRLRTVSIRQLPEGWCGKNHAMHRGVAASVGEWLLFTDADCRFHSPIALSMAIHDALAEEADFLCVTPILEMKTLWERIMQPVCAMTLMVWFLPHRVNKPGKKTAYANGAFMLLRRGCYDAIGGHERVRGELNEDIQLARLAKGTGFRLRVVENENLYSTRMYNEPGSAWRGWGRIFFGSLGSLRRLAISAMLLILLAIVPWISLLVAVLVCLSGDGSGGAWRVAFFAWLAVVVLQQFVVSRVYRILRAGSLWSLTYFLGSVVTLGVIGSAMLKALGVTGTSWRGTTYRGAASSDVQPSTRSDGGQAHDRTAACGTRRGPDVVEEPATHA